MFGQNLISNAVFTFGITLKNAFFGSCHQFQEIIILPKQFWRTKKVCDHCLQVVIWSNLSQNGWFDEFRL